MTPARSNLKNLKKRVGLRIWKRRPAAGSRYGHPNSKPQRRIEMKAEFTRFGIKHDYRGAHVAWTIGDRNYLGTVVGIFRDESVGVTMFQVRHFNGEDAPNVAAAYVDILPRNFEGFASPDA